MSFQLLTRTAKHVFAATILLAMVSDVVLPQSALAQQTPISAPVTAAPAGALTAGDRALALADRVAALLVRIAPFKQYDLSTNTPDVHIGRTPGSACEVLRFLVDYSAMRPGNTPVTAKIGELSQWIIGLQEANTRLPSYGGVPSTPDLVSPSNGYYYTMDSALCAEAMVTLYRSSGNEAHLRSAVAFASHLVAMQGGPRHWSAHAATDNAGFCEYVVVVHAHAAWNCTMHVKSLVALGPLRDISTITGNPLYVNVATQARRALYPGLAGAWEYADAAARSRPLAWRRLDGPHGERDTFVYGDTIAYALRGLYQFDQDHSDVRALYLAFTAYGAGGTRTHSYDARIAYAGYLVPASRSADEFSAYYDLATLGILYDLRALHPGDAAVSSEALLHYAGEASSASWLLPMDLSRPDDAHVDTTTLANIGDAAVTIYRDENR